MLSHISPRATMQQVLMMFNYTPANAHVQKVLHSVKTCRTAALGYHVYQCMNEDCTEKGRMDRSPYTGVAAR